MSLILEWCISGARDAEWKSAFSRQLVVLYWKIGAAIAHWRIVRDRCLSEFIRFDSSSPRPTKPALGGRSRQSVELETRPLFCRDYSVVAALRRVDPCCADIFPWCRGRTLQTGGIDAKRVFDSQSKSR